MLIDAEADRAMQSRVRPPREPRPWLPLVNAVLALAGPAAELLCHEERPWASVTFAGTRHTVSLTFAAEHGMDAADAFLNALPDHEFTLKGKLVADAAIIAVEQTLLPAPRIIVQAELLLLNEV